MFQRLGLTADDLRVDRLLAEAQATAGDPLTLTRLFGITDTTAIRYCLELGPLDRDADPPKRLGEDVGVSPRTVVVSRVVGRNPPATSGSGVGQSGVSHRSHACGTSMRAPSSRPATVALVVAALAVLVVAGRLLSSLPNATPPATTSAPTAGPLRLPDLIGQPLAQATTTLGQMDLKAAVQAQMGWKGVVLHPKTPSGNAIVIGQTPPAGERPPPSGVVDVAISTDAQPNNTPRQVRLGAGPATAAYPIAVPGTATHQLTVLVTMPAAARVAIWLEPPGLDRRLPVAGTPGATGCQPTGEQVHCRAVFAALDAELSGLWRMRLAKHSALPADVQITVVVVPR